jgi:hypothetical protein
MRRRKERGRRETQKIKTFRQPHLQPWIVALVQPLNRPPAAPPPPSGPRRRRCLLQLSSRVKLLHAGDAVAALLAPPPLLRRHFVGSGDIPGVGFGWLQSC